LNEQDSIFSCLYETSNTLAMADRTLDIVNAMDNVLWSPHLVQSTILSRAGYKHGFCGIGDLTYQTVTPHHCRQVHGTKILPASDATLATSENRPDADGIYTTTNNAVAVKTADCLPLLIASTTSKFAMAVHAGWRGLTSGILKNALKCSESYVPLESLVICIGPALSTDAFEVGRDVVDRIVSADFGLPEVAWPLAVAKGRHDRWHIDLQLAAAMQLYIAGVKTENIEVVRRCTRTDINQNTQQDQTIKPYVWHSYRREGQGCGSNWSWIKPL
jgi:YfiH family protein